MQNIRRNEEIGRFGFFKRNFFTSSYEPLVYCDFRYNTLNSEQRMNLIFNHLFMSIREYMHYQKMSIRTVKFPEPIKVKIKLSGEKKPPNNYQINADYHGNLAWNFKRIHGTFYCMTKKPNSVQPESNVLEPSSFKDDESDNCLYIKECQSPDQAGNITSQPTESETESRCERPPKKQFLLRSRTDTFDSTLESQLGESEAGSSNEESQLMEIEESPKKQLSLSYMRSLSKPDNPLWKAILDGSSPSQLGNPEAGNVSDESQPMEIEESPKEQLSLSDMSSLSKPPNTLLKDILDGSSTSQLKNPEAENVSEESQPMEIEESPKEQLSLSDMSSPSKPANSLLRAILDGPSTSQLRRPEAENVSEESQLMNIEESPKEQLLLSNLSSPSKPANSLLKAILDGPSTSQLRSQQRYLDSVNVSGVPTPNESVASPSRKRSFLESISFQPSQSRESDMRNVSGEFQPNEYEGSPRKKSSLSNESSQLKPISKELSSKFNITSPSQLTKSETRIVRDDHQPSTSGTYSGKRSRSREKTEIKTNIAPTAEACIEKWKEDTRRENQKKDKDKKTNDGNVFETNLVRCIKNLIRTDVEQKPASTSDMHNQRDVLNEYNIPHNQTVILKLRSTPGMAIEVSQNESDLNNIVYAISSDPEDSSNLNPSNLNPSNLNPSNLNPSNLNPSNLEPTTSQGHSKNFNLSVVVCDPSTFSPENLSDIGPLDLSINSLRYPSVRNSRDSSNFNPSGPSSTHPSNILLGYLNNPYANDPTNHGSNYLSNLNPSNQDLSNFSQEQLSNVYPSNPQNLEPTDPSNSEPRGSDNYILMDLSECRPSCSSTLYETYLASHSRSLADISNFDNIDISQEDSSNDD